MSLDYKVKIKEIVTAKEVGGFNLILDPDPPC